MRNNFGHHTITVCDQYCFGASSQAYILAELVLEDFEADGAHGGKVATRGYFVNADRRGHDGATERLVTRGAAAGRIAIVKFSTGDTSWRRPCAMPRATS